MPEVNFLPLDQIQNKKVQSVSVKLKLFAAVFGFLCLIVAVIGSIYIFYRNTTVTALQKQADDLKEKVLAQESTEQTLVFLRDRLGKIKDIESKNTSNTNYLAEKSVFDTFSTDVTLKQLDFSPSDSNFAVTVPNPETLGDLLVKMKTKDFSEGYVDTISYNPQIGYQVKFKIK